MEYKNKKGGCLARQGFTLTEILVVVLVAAVLAAVAYPLYTKSITNARAVEAVNLIEMVKNKQIENYARNREYYNKFADMGQLTKNPSIETPSNAMVQIKDYTLALNTTQNCITASYEKRGTRFSFSSSYENPGLGCDGDICAAFGDVIGKTRDVCNCGDNKCPGGIQNPETCECGECNPGDSEPCGNCGTKICNSAYKWGACEDSGVCTPTSRRDGGCSYGGYQLCSSSCQWGNCQGVGACNPGAVQSCGTCGTQSCGSNYQWGVCNEKGKPADDSQACGKCGLQSRTYTCQKTATTANWIASSWGACGGQGVCSPNTTETQNCAAGYTGTQTRTCNASCSWGSWSATCSAAAKDCPAASKPAASQACGNCGTQTRNVTCNTSTGVWQTGSFSACSGQGVCAPGVAETQNCAAGYSGTQTRTCSTSCTWGSWTGTCTLLPKDCPAASKPAATQTCGKCGTQTRTVTCNTSTGAWQAGAFGACSGEGVCTPGEKGICAKKGAAYGGTKSCTNSCTWSYCSGFTTSCCCTGNTREDPGACRPYVVGISTGGCKTSLQKCPNIETIVWRE